MKRQPVIFANFKPLSYRGPGWHEWLFGVAVTILGVFEVSEILKSRRAQTADSYYFQTPGVLVIHGIAIAVVGAILVCLALWIAQPKWAKPLRIGVISLSVIGFSLIWIELSRAVTVRDPRYLLDSLPFHPINNLGLWGASVFGAYLILKMSPGHLKPLPATLIKLSFVIGLYVCQLIFYEKFGLGAYA